MENGSKLSTERMGTVLATTDGGLWLGAYDKGIFYSHPCMIQKNTGLLRFRPILSHFIPYYQKWRIVTMRHKRIAKSREFHQGIILYGDSP